MLFFSIKSQELVDFTKSLSVMLKSGITIDEALLELEEQGYGRYFSKIIKAIRVEIERGISLSDAFSKYQRAFGGVFIAVIRAGEASGTLEENLNFLAMWLEHNNDIRREVHGAMIYPAIVFIATISLSAGLSLLVLPRLLPVFAQMAVELPLPTRILLAITHFLESYWALAFILLAAIVVGFIFLMRVTPFRRVMDYIFLHIPFIGKLLIQYQLTLISQLFTTLFRSGLSIHEIIDITTVGVTNLIYRDALLAIGKGVYKGNTLTSGLRLYPKCFPRNMVSIIAVGEKSGTLEDSFEYLTEYYRKEVYSATKRLPTVIEPLLLLVMGVMVAFVAISIILPIYQFTAQINR